MPLASSITTILISTLKHTYLYFNFYRDALYGIPTGDQFFGWGVTKSAVIIGAIHSTTIKASYSEVSINQYNLITNMVVDSVNFVPDESFVGSASRFLPAGKLSLEELLCTGGVSFHVE